MDPVKVIVIHADGKFGILQTRTQHKDCLYDTRIGP